MPDGFVFSLKGNRSVTNRKVLADAGESMERFLGSGITELGDHLGPLLWQFAKTKKLGPDDFGGFLSLLPASRDGIELRHAVEVRHDSFVCPEFVDLIARYGVAIVYAEHDVYPEIADITVPFVYARLQKGDDDIPTAYTSEALDQWAGRCGSWAEGSVPDDLPRADPARKPDAHPRDVFVYFIHEGKVQAPQATMTLQQRVARPRPESSRCNVNGEPDGRRLFLRPGDPMPAMSRQEQPVARFQFAGLGLVFYPQSRRPRSGAPPIRRPADRTNHRAHCSARSKRFVRCAHLRA